VGTIDPARGLLVLEQLMREQATRTVVFPVDWAQYAQALGDRPVPRFLSNLIAARTTSKKRETEQPGASPAGPSALMQEIAATPPDSRPRVVLNHVRDQAIRILALPASRPIDPRQPLQELGLDSLMAVELRNVLSGSIGRPLPATLLFDYPTIDALAGYLTQTVLGVTPAAGGEAESAPDKSEQVIDRIEEMSDEEVDRLLADRVARKQRA
jgi:acyl carrier protein